MVRVPDLQLKGHGFESLQVQRKNVILQGQLSVLTLLSVTVPPSPGGRLQLKTHTPYIYTYGFA